MKKENFSVRFSKFFFHFFFFVHENTAHLDNTLGNFLFILTDIINQDLVINLIT